MAAILALPLEQIQAACDSLGPRPYVAERIRQPPQKKDHSVYTANCYSPFLTGVIRVPPKLSLWNHEFHGEYELAESLLIFVEKHMYIQIVRSALVTLVRDGLMPEDFAGECLQKYLNHWDQQRDKVMAKRWDFAMNFVNGWRLGNTDDHLAKLDNSCEGFINARVDTFKQAHKILFAEYGGQVDPEEPA
jgi:hypothetical protein